MKRKTSHSKIVRTIPPDILLWLNEGRCDQRLISRASRRNHKHSHNPAAQPSYLRPSNKKRLTPAQYRKMTKAINADKKARWLKQIQAQRRATVGV